MQSSDPVSQPDSTAGAATSQANEPPQLSDADMARVDKYLSSPIHSVERKPFKPILMMFALVGVVVGLGGLSMFIAWIVL